MGDEGLLRQLGEECARRLSSAAGEDRVTLLYYQANTYSAIIEANQEGPDYIWNWQNPDGIQNILLLRQAIGEEAFGHIHSHTRLPDTHQPGQSIAFSGPARGGQ